MMRGRRRCVAPCQRCDPGLHTRRSALTRPIHPARHGTALPAGAAGFVLHCGGGADGRRGCGAATAGRTDGRAGLYARLLVTPAARLSRTRTGGGRLQAARAHVCGCAAAVLAVSLPGQRGICVCRLLCSSRGGQGPACVSWPRIALLAGPGSAPDWRGPTFPPRRRAAASAARRCLGSHVLSLALACPPPPLGVCARARLSAARCHQPVDCHRHRSCWRGARSELPSPRRLSSKPTPARERRGAAAACVRACEPGKAGSAGALGRRRAAASFTPLCLDSWQ